MPTVVNDLHSALNATPVAAIVTPCDLDDLGETIIAARAAGRALSIAGGRHAMGGQQFGTGTILVDTRALDRVVAFDALAGHITVEGGIQWPALLEYLESAQLHGDHPWGIYQKQTGADRLTLGGALSCNAHGRGLTLKPIVQQVESFDLMDAKGDLVHCSRDDHPELFRLAIGGYGLFGVIARVTLRLRPRLKVRRVVTLGDTADIMGRFEARIRDGFLYGDFQFAIDDAHDGFLRRGIFSCYEPVPSSTPLTESPARFLPEDWTCLTELAHSDKSRAFEIYARRYLDTSGQVYWADAQLSSAYVDDYHAEVDRALGAAVKGSEMITELYVERHRLAAFMEDARVALRARRANVIYGTVRLIEQDDETFLPWARGRYACIVFNLHVDHTPAAIETAAGTFRDLIDLAIAHGGSYYLTYHRWARPDQVARCYPEMPAFLDAKLLYDPQERFQSDWYRQLRDQALAPPTPRISRDQRKASANAFGSSAGSSFARRASCSARSHSPC
jgi:FAD/FMN-containing dehydrogenase